MRSKPCVCFPDHGCAGLAACRPRRQSRIPSPDRAAARPESCCKAWSRGDVSCCSPISGRRCSPYQGREAPPPEDSTGGGSDRRRAESARRARRLLLLTAFEAAARQALREPSRTCRRALKSLLHPRPSSVGGRGTSATIPALTGTARIVAPHGRRSGHDDRDDAQSDDRRGRRGRGADRRRRRLRVVGRALRARLSFRQGRARRHHRGRLRDRHGEPGYRGAGRLAGLGQIKELLVDFNSEVKKNQVIARIDPESFQLRVNQAMADVEAARATVLTQRANVAALQAEVSRAKVNLADAEREFQRNKGLFEKNFVSAAALDKAQAAYRRRARAGQDGAGAARGGRGAGAQRGGTGEAARFAARAGEGGSRAHHHPRAGGRHRRSRSRWSRGRRWRRACRRRSCS